MYIYIYKCSGPECTDTFCSFSGGFSDIMWPELSGVLSSSLTIALQLCLHWVSSTQTAETNKKFFLFLTLLGMDPLVPELFPPLKSVKLIQHPLLVLISLFVRKRDQERVWNQTTKITFIAGNCSKEKRPKSWQDCWVSLIHEKDSFSPKRAEKDFPN